MHISDKVVLDVFERRILRKTYELIWLNHEFRRQKYHELYDLHSDMKMVERVKIQQIRRLGRVGNMKTPDLSERSYDDDCHGCQRCQETWYYDGR